MGLDMYAYAIQKELVQFAGDVDVNVYKAARAAVGFNDLEEDVVNAMDEPARKDYWTAYHKANDKAKTTGVFDPDFGYWRKFNALHGWMEQLYRSKGGQDEDFNCCTVRIEPEDLDALMDLAERNKLEPTQGFFFGEQTIDEDDIASIFSFAYKAKAAFAKDMAVFYDSWW